MEKVDILKFKLEHNKAFFPANKNAVEYIEQTVRSVMGKFEKVRGMEFYVKDMAVEVELSIDADITVDKMTVIVNRINKVGKNISKRYKKHFSPLNLGSVSQF